MLTPPLVVKLRLAGCVLHVPDDGTANEVTPEPFHTETVPQVVTAGAAELIPASAVAVHADVPASYFT